MIKTNLFNIKALFQLRRLSGYNWEKYKKWKYGDELSGGYLRREEVAGGGRLTRTIPPERGPVPQGLSYLLYDDTMRTGSK